MKKRGQVKELLWAVAFVIVASLLAGLVSRALRPVRLDYGAVWGPYLAEPRDSLDYLYLGSSYAYCDVDPAAVYAESGLTGYVLAGPEQTMSQTYWYLREALNTQRPSLVLLEASSLQFERYQNYTQINVGYMPTGINKLGAILTASEPELRVGLLFDLYFYHSRWSEVTLTELAKALLGRGTDTLKGYTAVDGVFEQIENGPFIRELQTEEIYQENLADLGRIAALCREKAVPLAVVFHPTYSQLPAEAYQRIQSDLAGLDPTVQFWNWSDDTLDIGLVPKEHYYDPGHLNRPGAAVFSAWLGRYLTDQAGLTPRPQTAENTAAWQAAAQTR